MLEIYNLLAQETPIKRDKLLQILDLAEYIQDDRNLGTHKRVYSKREVEEILEKITPMLNDLMIYLSTL